MVISAGRPAPPLPGGSREAPLALVFFKVTCPTCQMAAPVLNGFERAYPGRIVGIGQDPVAALTTFAERYGLTFPSCPDEPPYDASNAYGIEHVPTLVVVGGDGLVADVVESWDRAGTNRASATLAALLGVEPVTVSVETDGLPESRPG